MGKIETAKALQEPFRAEDIEWRAQMVGISGDKPYAMVLAYVTNRAIQSRLDSVMGVDGWQNTFEKAPDGGVMCGISCKFGSEWVTKYDAAPNTDVEAVKGGISNAMKRAAVQWGIGRYLYKLDATFAECSLEKKQGWIVGMTKDKKKVWWKIPTLPKWALPNDDDSQSKGVDEEHEEEQCEQPKKVTIGSYLSGAGLNPNEAKELVAMFKITAETAAGYLSDTKKLDTAIVEYRAAKNGVKIIEE